MGMFDGMENAQIGRGGYYYKDGNYIADVVKCYSQDTRKIGNMFIVESQIVWSNNPERKVGQVPSWCVVMDWDTALGHVKGFIAACNGADPSDDEAVKACFTDAQGRDISVLAAEYAVSPDNPLAGTRLELEVYSSPSKKTGKDFSAHKWKPYDEATFSARLALVQG